MTVRKAWIRGVVAGIVGGLAWIVGIVVFFGPAQAVLSNPAYQSEKMLAAFEGDPAPRTVAAPWLLPVSIVGITILWGWVYIWISSAWPRPWWKRGLRFSILSWILMVPWFEFYLPFNVLHEPAALVLLEMACWAGVLCFVGLAIAGADDMLRPISQQPVVKGPAPHTRPNGGGGMT